jgi:hypothetical protein
LDPQHARCRDLLLDGGRSGLGSCCPKDRHWGQFCDAASGGSGGNGGEVARAAVCDPASELFGTQQAVLSANNGSALANEPGLWEEGQAGNWQHLLEVGGACLRGSCWLARLAAWLVRVPCPWCVQSAQLATALPCAALPAVRLAHV